MDWKFRAAATSTWPSLEKLSAMPESATNIHRRAINITPVSVVSLQSLVIFRFALTADI